LRRRTARSNASRITRSTPYAVLMLTSVAISCDVLVRTVPPLPQYRPSVPSRTTTKSISLPVMTLSASGVGTPG
jgi:hypothetical protein